MIEIHEKIYEKLAVEKEENIPWDYVEKIITAITYGTPLPKGYGRLIDADALDIDNLDRAYDNNFELDFGRLYTADVIDMIANAPTIIEADKGD